MRIAVAVDYGKYANASSLHLVARKVFLELGKIMNEKRTFTVSAIKYEDIGIGDVNQHYDFVSIPNMGGYKFPHLGTLTAKNLGVGIVGIDEVVLGEQVFKSKSEWLINKPIIEREVPKWKKYIDKIKFVHISNNSEKQQMTQYLKIPEEKLPIVPLGVDHEIFKPPVNKEKIRKKILGKFFHLDFPYFIHVSETNWARKNVLRVLEAFEKLKNEGIKHNLIIVGRMEPVVYKKAETIRGVIILGFVSEEHLVMLLQGADAMVFPSLHEGFGLPPLEAMSCGVPVIASNVFSLPEIVGNGGIFVDPYNVEDIANKMREIAENEELQKTLSYNAIEKSKEFSWEFTAKGLLKLIEQNTDCDSKDFDFEKNLDLAAYRTLTTVCEILPDLRNTAQQDLRECNYTRIISWATETGLEHPTVKDYLVPFKDWLSSHSE